MCFVGLQIWLYITSHIFLLSLSCSGPTAIHATSNRPLVDASVCCYSPTHEVGMPVTGAAGDRMLYVVWCYKFTTSHKRNDVNPFCQRWWRCAVEPTHPKKPTRTLKPDTLVPAVSLPPVSRPSPRLVVEDLHRAHLGRDALLGRATIGHPPSVERGGRGGRAPAGAWSGRRALVAGVEGGGDGGSAG